MPIAASEAWALYYYIWREQYDSHCWRHAAFAGQGKTQNILIISFDCESSSQTMVTIVDWFWFPLVATISKIENDNI